MIFTWAVAHVEKPDHFMFQLEAPDTRSRTRRRAAREELAAETDNLKAMAAWASQVQTG